MARGLQDRHLCGGAGCSYCVHLNGVTPANHKIAPCDRLTEPFGYWFNVAGWTLCYFLMLWLAWSIPTLRSS